MGMSAEFKEIVEYEHVVWAEAYDSWPEGATTVTATFEEADGKTKITVDTVYLSQEARDIAMQPGFEEGFASSYAQLDEVLAHLGLS